MALPFDRFFPVFLALLVGLVTSLAGCANGELLAQTGSDESTSVVRTASNVISKPITNPTPDSGLTPNRFVGEAFESNDQTDGALSNVPLTNSSWFDAGAVSMDGPLSQLNQISKIPVSVGGLWMTDSQTGLTNFDSSLKFPILKLFGSPPPIVKAGFSYTQLSAGPGLGLPENLFEYTIGVSGVRWINDRWTMRTMLGVGFATDNQNTSSDSWQFRGGAFGIYRANDQWQWSVGAIALGRDDLPVIPAIGAIWTPSEYSRWDLILPNPRINFLMSDDGVQQQWFYVGGGFNGTTWGYESATLGDDQVTYGDLRVVSGWKVTPKAPLGVPYAKGRKFFAEIGYAFSRDLEFNDEQTEISLDDAFMFRIGTDY